MPTNNMGPYSSQNPTLVMAETVFIAEALPNLTASQPSLTDGNNSLVNAAPATGLITVPQSPAGTSVTSTGRSVSASQAFLTQARTEGLWNGVRVPTNPV